MNTITKLTRAVASIALTATIANARSGDTLKTV